MRPTAIVYTSNTGFTERYAKALGAKTSLPVYRLEDCKKDLPAGTPILYFGWLFASNVKKYREAAKRYRICAVCAVGLCDTGALLEEARAASKIPAEVPLFTLQGGMHRDRLRGVNRMIIGMLTKMLASKKDRTEDEERQYLLVRDGGDYYREENLADVLAWLDKA